MQASLSESAVRKKRATPISTQTDRLGKFPRKSSKTTSGRFRIPQNWIQSLFFSRFFVKKVCKKFVWSLRRFWFSLAKHEGKQKSDQKPANFLQTFCKLFTNFLQTLELIFASLAQISLKDFPAEERKSGIVRYMRKAPGMSKTIILDTMKCDCNRSTPLDKLRAKTGQAETKSLTWLRSH